MKARQFFATLKTARVRDTEKQAYFLYQMVAVACAPTADAKWREKLQNSFRKVFDPDMQTKMLDNETAGRILTSMFGGN